MELLGIDNVFFQVGNLEKAILFYEKLGFRLKFKIHHLPGALFHIGKEEPGLILCETKEQTPARLWIEVESAKKMKAHCASIGIQGSELETSTGITFEIKDIYGNMIGFADYSKKQNLARYNQKSIKGIAETYAHRIWDKKDLSAIDDLIHQEIVLHSLLGDFHGQESMRKVVQAWLIGFPDLTVNNISVICERDLVVIHWQAQGSHQGEFKGIKPTGKPISYAGVTIYLIQDEKITEYWAYLDMQYLLKQIS